MQLHVSFHVCSFSIPCKARNAEHICVQNVCEFFGFADVVIMMTDLAYDTVGTSIYFTDDCEKNELYNTVESFKDLTPRRFAKENIVYAYNIILVHMVICTTVLGVEKTSSINTIRDVISCG
jgi:hypothetical protein